MDASTVLEIVRICASGFGSVLAAFLGLRAHQEYQYEQRSVPSTRDEVVTRTDRVMTRASARTRAIITLVMQLGMLYVAWDAFQNQTDGVVSALALKSNLNQILNIVAATVIALFDLKDISAREYIREIAEYVPPKRSRRAFTAQKPGDGDGGTAYGGGVPRYSSDD